MTLAIIKAPSSAGQTVMLGADFGVASDAKSTMAGGQTTMPSSLAPSPQETARREAEASIRTALQKEYEAKYEAEREKAFEQGYKKGMEAGHQEGVAMGEDGFKKQIQLLERLLAKAEEAHALALAQSESLATELAFESIVLLLGEHALAPAVIDGMVARVTASLREADVLRIRLHPADCSALRAALRQGEPVIDLAATAGLIQKLQEDATLVLGGCVVETPRGEYRATLDVQLRRLRGILDQKRSLPLDVATNQVRHALRA